MSEGHQRLLLHLARQTNQARSPVFVRQGILLQVSDGGGRSSRGRSRLASFGRQPYEAGQWLGGGGGGQTGDGQAHNELVRQCFLFTNHLLLCTRTKEGKLELLEVS